MLRHHYKARLYFICFSWFCFPSSLIIIPHLLQVNASNGYATSVTEIQINVLPVPRPPVIFDQSREVFENVAANTAIGGRLLATHPQVRSRGCTNAPNAEAAATHGAHFATAVSAGLPGV